MINVITVVDPKLKNCIRVASDSGIAYFIPQNQVDLSLSSTDKIGANRAARKERKTQKKNNSKIDIDKLLKNEAYEKRMQLLSGKDRK